MSAPPILFQDAPPTLGLVFMAGAFLGLTWLGVRKLRQSLETGTFRYLGSTYRRESSPILFWCEMTMQGAGIVLFGLLAIASTTIAFEVARARLTGLG